VGGVAANWGGGCIVVTFLEGSSSVHLHTLAPLECAKRLDLFNHVQSSDRAFTSLHTGSTHCTTVCFSCFQGVCLSTNVLYVLFVMKEKY